MDVSIIIGFAGSAVAVLTGGALGLVLWQLRANDRNSEDRTRRIVGAVRSALPAPVVAWATAHVPARAANDTEDRASGAYPSSRLLGNEELYALAAGAPGTPEECAAEEGLTLEPSPALPPNWPATIDGTAILYRPGPYAYDAVLTEVAGHRLRRLCLPHHVGDVRALRDILKASSRKKTARA